MRVQTGYIYALSNPAMPGLVKVGRATDVERRVKMLSSATGVPQPFHLLSAVFVDDYRAAEEEAHSLLWFCRESERREFYRCHYAMALDALECAAKLLATPDDVWEISYPFRKKHEFVWIANAERMQNAGPQEVTA